MQTVNTCFIFLQLIIVKDKNLMSINFIIAQKRVLVYNKNAESDQIVTLGVIILY